MKKIMVLLMVLALGTALSTTATAQATIEGAWKRVETSVTSPDTSYTNSHTQPSLLIFTEKHYSSMYVRGNEPRQLFANPGEGVTDAELVAAYRSFVANSGTYEVSGTTLKRKVVVARSPNFMAEGPTRTHTYKIEGNTLWLTWKSDDGLTTAVIKLTRLE